MNFEFENRWYSKHEILKQFNIAEKPGRTGYTIARQERRKI